MRNDVNIDLSPVFEPLVNLPTQAELRAQGVWITDEYWEFIRGMNGAIAYEDGYPRTLYFGHYPFLALLGLDPTGGPHALDLASVQQRLREYLPESIHPFAVDELGGGFAFSSDPEVLGCVIHFADCFDHDIGGLPTERVAATFMELVEGLRLNEYRFPGPNTDLVEAIESGDMNEVVSLVRSGIDLSGEDQFGKTFVRTAIDLQQYEIAAFLLSKGAPAHHAIGVVNDDIVKQILPHIKGDDLSEFVTRVVQVKSWLKAALARKPNLAWQHPDGAFAGETALHEAARDGLIQSIKMLCEAGANPNAKTFAGNTPLHVAAEHKQLDALATLVRLGGQVEIINEQGQTCLDLIRSSTARRNVEKKLGLRG